MAKKGINWYLSALLAVGAVALGFWLGVAVLNWYSDREYNAELTSEARPVSILSGGEKKPITKEDPENGELAIIEIIENDENLALVDSLELTAHLKPDSLKVVNGNNVNGLDTVANHQGQTLGEYNFIKMDKDRLVATLSFALPKSAKKPSLSTQQLDSLLGKPITDSPREEIITVELWKSPLNFRGYKFSNNVLVVYDMTQVDALKLYQSGGNLYVSYFDVFYQITPSTQFRALNPTKTPL